MALRPGTRPGVCSTATTSSVTVTADSRRSDSQVDWVLRDNALPHRVEHDLSSVVQIELLHQIPAMSLDG